MSSFFVKLDTKNAQATSDGVYRWSLGPRAGKLTNLKGVALIECSFPNIFYNIKAGELDLVIETDVDAKQTVSIPAGHYGITELINQLESNINASITNIVTLDLNSITGFIDFSIDIGTVKFYSQTEDADSTLAPLVGLVVSQGLSPSGSFNEFPSLSGTKHLKLLANFIHSASMSLDDDVLTPILAPFTIESDFGEYHVEKQQTDEYTTFFSRREAISYIELTLKEDDDENVIFPVNHNMSVTLKFYV